MTDEQRVAVMQACDEVQWKPHWMPGGNYSVCGPWPRAIWVARAMGCSKKQAMDWVIVGVFIGVSCTILTLGCAAIAWRRTAPVCKNAAKPATKAAANATIKLKDVEVGSCAEARVSVEEEPAH